MFYRGQLGVVNYTMAAKWFRKAAEQGSGTAHFNLGFMYRFGQGVESNFARAMDHFRKASDLDNIDAQYNVSP